MLYVRSIPLEPAHKTVVIHGSSGEMHASIENRQQRVFGVWFRIYFAKKDVLKYFNVTKVKKINL